MRLFLRHYWPLIFLAIFIAVLYWPSFVESKIPLPADTIVGLYHPWRDFFADKFPLGIPFKNFLITDSVRQQFPWRQLSIEIFKRGELPMWNPYSFAGTPLLANLQSAPFYPLNILYWLFSFSVAWTMQVILQSVLGSLFIVWYLRSLRLRPEAQAVGALCWIGSGFFVAWLEWNTAVQVAIWLPLILLSIDKILVQKGRSRLVWSIIFVIALTSSFFAGYLQPFFYVLTVSVIYLLARTATQQKIFTLLFFGSLYFFFFLLTLPQMLPTLQFILLSARDIDQFNWTRPDWFLPWQHLAQLLAPDYFGNPATLNYFGVWNYQEFVSYIGIGGLLCAIASLFRRDRRTFFFWGLLFFALLFALPTPLAKLPFELRLPFISSAQPSRLVFLVDFSLAVLAAFGLDWLLKNRLSIRQQLFLLTPFGLSFAILWVAAIKWELVVSLRNLYFPTLLVVASSLFLILFYRLSRFRTALMGIFLLLIAVDLGRFFLKFESFSARDYLYPSTKSIEYLENQSRKEIFRIASADDRILPPNFSTIYRLQAISGYDPLYLRRFGEFVIAMERNKPDISLPWGFNRIIVPKNYSSKLFDLLGVKYLLSLNDINDNKLQLVFKEGATRIYQNKSVLPRAFFVEKAVVVESEKDELDTIFGSGFDPRRTATFHSSFRTPPRNFANGQVKIDRYSENGLTLTTQIEASSAGFLVVTDSLYPGWQATIDDRPTKIFLTDYLFRGMIVPPGNHIIKMSYSLSLPSLLTFR